MGFSVLAGGAASGGFGGAAGGSALGSLSGVAGSGLGMLGYPYLKAETIYRQQKAFQTKAYRLQARSARASEARQYGDLAIGSAIQGESASYDINTIAEESMMGVASTIASAAQAGVSGNNVAAAIDSFRRVELMRKEAVRRNLFYDALQRQRRGDVIQAQTYQQILSGIGTPIQSPDYIGMALGTLQQVGGMIAGMPGVGGPAPQAGQGNAPPESMPQYKPQGDAFQGGQGQTIY